MEKISQMVMQNTQSTVGVYVARKGLDVMEMQGQMAVALINSAGNAANPAGTGTLVNKYV
ncbi:hypothetical protein MBAV_005399 [Candidatus Magnetobacterium bavaricum]|uniref:Motility protein n=1 Tax=Candidatus Magnetobacterium bavaricum TaxID=29290 RepID=A0A0F3GKJ7_9BACT|nr:hypothetical protein MBAV_005399 [Candidatus Magnetobacterium bavaricum]